MLTIMFFGLITHFRVGGIERAVLVAETDHLAVMIINVDYLPSPSQIDAFVPPGQIYVDNQNRRWAAFPLDGTHLKFENLPGGTTEIDPIIPRLSQITDASEPLANVKTGLQHSRTTAYIDYTGGNLAAGCLCSLRWMPPQPPSQGGLPSATWKFGTATPQVNYTGTAIDKPFILSATKHLDLDPNATIYIINLTFPDTSAAGHTHKHYKDNLGLFVDGSNISEMISEPCKNSAGGHCSLGELSTAVMTTARNPSILPSLLRLPLDFHIFDVGSPECTDSHFP